MSRPIDEKIVKMSLDNSDFKKKASETIASFESINKNIKSSADTTSLSKIADGISSIQKRFTISGMAVASVVNNLVGSTIAGGKRMAGALISPIVEGGEKRALNIEQAKFQFKGLGMDVEAAMESAMGAVKGTAYGLDDAAVVASQFGAAGMKAGDEMTKSLRGISGVAAMTGSSYSDIGSIFTSVAGNGRLMGDDLLRLSSRGVNAAATLGKALGKSEADIRDLVSKGKIDFKTFSDAMNDAFGEHATKANETYVGSLSNVKAALSRVGAAFAAPEFENKRNIFNNLTPKIDEVAAAIKPLIAVWVEFNKVKTDNIINFMNKVDFKKFEELGGINSLTVAFKNSLDMVVVVLKAVKDGFQRVFPPATVNTFVGMAKGIENLSNKLKLTEKGVQNLTTVCQAVAAVFSIVWKAAKFVGSALKALIPDNLGSTFMDLVLKLSKVIIEFDKTFLSSEKAKKGFESLHDVVNKIADGIVTAFSFVFKVIKNISNVVGQIGSALMPVLKRIGSGIKDALSVFTIEDLLNGGLVVSLIAMSKKFKGIAGSITGVFDKIKGAVGNLGKNLNVFEDLTKHLSAMTNAVKAKSLMSIALAVGVLAVSLKVLASIKAADLSKGLASIGAMLVMLNTSLSFLSKSNLGVKNAITGVATILALSAAIIVLSVGLKILASIKSEDMIKGLISLVIMIGTLVGAVGVLSKVGGKIQTSSVGIVALSVAVLILAVAVKKLASIDSADAMKGLVGLGVIFLELAVFMKIANKSKIGPGTAIGITIIAGAIHIMVSAIKKIAAIDTNSLIKGLGVIGIILLEVGLFTKLAGGSGTMSAALGMVLIAAAIQMLITPIQQFASMSVNELIKGLGALAIVLGEVVLAMRLANGGLAGAMGIAAVAVSMLLLVIPLKIFAAMTWEQIIKGLVGLGGALGIVALSSKLIGLQGALALLAFAAAVTAVGIAALLVATAIGVFAAALVVLASLTASSIASIINALGLLLSGLIGLVPQVLQLISLMISGMAMVIIQNAPILATAAGELILAVLTAMATYIPQFSEQAILMVTGLMDTFAQQIGPVVQSATELIIATVDAMANAIRENQDQIVRAVLGAIEAVLEILITALVEVVQVLYGWIPGVNKATDAMGKGAKDALRTAFDIKDVGSKGASDFTSGVSSEAGKAKSAGEGVGKGAKAGMGGVKLTEDGTKASTQYIKGLTDKKAAAGTGGKDIGNAAKKGAGDVQLTATGATSGNQFASGLSNLTGISNSRGAGLGNAAQSGAGSVSLYGTGENAGDGFASGISSKGGAVERAAASLASIAKAKIEADLAIKSPSRELMKTGGFTGEGFAIGISESGRMVETASSGLATRALDTIKGFTARFSEALMNTLDLNPVIRPVLDTSGLNMRDFRFDGSVQVPEGSTGVPGSTYNITINTQSQDPKAVANEVEKILTRKVQS